jgi:SpoVK/Ycf46/Vps4 family AAA+-type ATPase
MDEEAALFLRPVEPLPVPTDHETVIERLTSVLSARLEEGTRPVVHLRGREISGKGAAARELSSRLGLDLYRLDVGRLPSSAADRRKVLRLLEREAVLLQAAYFVDVDAFGDRDESADDIVEDVLEELDATLLVAGEIPDNLRRKVYEISLKKPDASVQEELWDRMLQDAGLQLNGRVADITRQFDFGPGRMRKAVASAQNQAELEGHAGQLAARDLWQACRRQAKSDMRELAREIEPTYAWEDIVLPEDTFDQLQEIAAQVGRRARVYGEWGFEDRLSRGLGISALFAGPSGTGKTMAAEILANDLNLDLYRIDLASMVSKYIGETEKNLKKVFDAAERSGAILFFDEADALFGKRTEVSDSHDRYANIEIDYLLQRMEEYRGLAVLATNRRGDMDRAFLRRLRFIVEFPQPDSEHRRIIWEQAFPEVAPVGELDFAFLARLEVTGANIQNIALNAAFLAAEQDTSIQMDHVMHAARREYDKIGKLITESEFGVYYERG